MEELRILLLEDNPVDAELLNRVLSKNFPTIAILCVDQEAEFKQALIDFKPDIVLTDYNIPGYSGQVAIEFINKFYPEVPVIIISGAIGEEKAVELIHSGARDYILKDRLGRLPTAIRRVIQEEHEAKIRMGYERQLYESEERIRNILNTALDAVISIDSSGVVTGWNAEAEKLFGYLRKNAMGKILSELIIPPELREAHINGLKRFLKTGESHKIGNRVETRAIRSDGTEFPIELSITVIYREKETFFNAFLRDITEQKKAEDALRESENRHRLLVENSPMCIHEIDLQGKIISMNSSGVKMMGLNDESEVRGYSYLDSVSEADRPHIEVLLQAAYNGQTSQFEFRSSTHKIQFYKSCFVPIKNKMGAVEKLMGISEDITQQKLDDIALHASESHFRQIADYDALTKLPNRRLLDDRLGQAMVASKRSGRYGALMFLDLDNFKPINDLHGHSAGDLLLIEVARRINSCVREADTVSRFGGDEFIVMLSELDRDRGESFRKAGIIAEKIRTILADPYVLTIQHEGKAEIEIRHNCTSSIGVVLFVNHESSSEEVIKWADIAMYKAKADGRNRICFYEASMNKQADQIDKSEQSHKMTKEVV